MDTKIKLRAFIYMLCTRPAHPTNLHAIIQILFNEQTKFSHFPCHSFYPSIYSPNFFLLKFLFYYQFKRWILSPTYNRQSYVNVDVQMNIMALDGRCGL